ncbi:molybdopterin converting factor subunit 1 [Aliiglaciecola sp. SL4]|uniref:molybdopterin converting factor subunit 1 n=1 Tax=Aliiglaciecola sp. SL4 TaxID=3239806 RepID=UPI00355C759F
MKILFFGQLREQLGVAELCLEERPNTVHALRELLAAKGEIWQQYLSSKHVLVAVNQTICDFDTAIEANDEIAFFPPVTGG